MILGIVFAKKLLDYLVKAYLFLKYLYIIKLLEHFEPQLCII